MHSEETLKYVVKILIFGLRAFLSAAVCLCTAVYMAGCEE